MTLALEELGDNKENPAPLCNERDYNPLLLYEDEGS